MGRYRTPDMTLQAQLVAVRRAASNAALAVEGSRTAGHRRKAETHRDALAQAAATLQAVRDSAEALARFPDAHREKLAIALAAGGYRAVLIGGEEPWPHRPLNLVQTEPVKPMHHALPEQAHG